MGDWFRDFGSFFVAIWKSWFSLISGFSGVVSWILGATLEPLPVTMRWILVAFGGLALIFAGFAVWRRVAVTDKRRLQLLRIIEDGDSCLLAYDNVPNGDGGEMLHVVGDMSAWHRETLATLRVICFAYWDHFADIGAFNTGDVDAKGKIVKLLKRIRDVCELMKPTKG